MNHKNFSISVKELGPRSLRACASDESVDRDDEVIKASAWTINGGLDEFKKNACILYAHDMKSLPIAKATDIWVEGGRLMVDISFPNQGVSKLSDEAYGLCKAGILTSLSVGFQGRKYEMDREQRRVYTDVSLYEISLVPCPANVNARIVSVKSRKTNEEFDLASIPYVPSKKSSGRDIDLDAIEFPTRLKNKEIDIDNLSREDVSLLVSGIVKEALRKNGLDYLI